MMWSMLVVIVWVFQVLVAEVLVLLFVVKVVNWIRQMLWSYFGLRVVLMVMYRICQMQW